MIICQQSCFTADGRSAYRNTSLCHHHQFRQRTLNHSSGTPVSQKCKQSPLCGTVCASGRLTERGQKSASRTSDTGSEAVIGISVFDSESGVVDLGQNPNLSRKTSEIHDAVVCDGDDIGRAWARSEENFERRWSFMSSIRSL
jgi:hypothetical protein